MSQILNKVRDVDPNNAEAVKDALSGFFQNLAKHTDLDCIRWLRTLESVITRFPKYCMSHRNTAEVYLINFLDSTNYFYVVEAAKCSHALQQVRPPQEKVATAKSCWRDGMKALCNSIHALLASIFPNVVDLYNGNTENQEPQTINSPLLSALANINTVKHIDKSVDKQSLLCTRLRNVFVFIQAMLVEVYPVAKPVQPQTILEALVRALSIVPSGTSNVDVTVIKIQVLRTVDALIACLGSNLLPFSALVISFVMQTLKWTSENSGNESSKVRCTAYSTLARWLDVLHTHRSANDRGRCWEDELARHVTDDVTPAKHVVQLTMSTQPTKNLSKKARKRLANSMLQGSSIASHMPGEKNKVAVSEQMNDEVAIAALECAETFLHVCGVFLKPTTHKLFQERLVRECFTLESYSSERALALLRALEACRKSAPATLAPPTQYCLQLYSVLINSQHREISKLSSQALLDIRLHLHCSPPTINFALEVADDNQKREAKKTKMFERNRAVLEAFLANTEPSENSSDIITIPDEPSNKKPRLDQDVSDKISVSSDSASSVEISDESDGEVELVEDNGRVIEENAEVNEGNSKDNEENRNEVIMEIDVIGSNSNATQATSKSTDEETNEINKETENISNDIVDSVTKTIEKEINTANTTIEICTASEVSTKSNKNSPPISLNSEKDNIYEATTQLPINVSDGNDEDMALSIEIAYDLPTTGKEVPVLEKNEDENLPSTNDTDDIQITCGQVVKYSQDDSEKAKEIEAEIPKVNGNKSPEKIDDVTIPEVTVKVNATNVNSIDDMLADFVDEVVEEIPNANECQVEVKL